MERKVEVRRHTEAGEITRWLPFPKSHVRTSIPTKDHMTVPYTNTRGSCGNISIGNKEGHIYYNPVAEKSPRRRTFDEQEIYPASAKAKWLPILSRSGHYSSEYPIMEDEISQLMPVLQMPRAQSSGRSLSADVSFFHRDSSSRWNERCPTAPDPSRLVSYRWMPETGARYIPSPVRRTSEGDRPRISTKWMNYAKGTTPSPVHRKFSDSRASVGELTAASSDSAVKETSFDRWLKEEQRRHEEEKKQEQEPSQPVRKIDTPSVADGQQKSGSQGEEDSLSADSRIKQRLRELYDFEIETEVPKRVRNPSRESIWTINKSNGEEDKTQQQQQQQESQRSASLTVRQSSQDMEFNEHTHKRSNGESSNAWKTTASVRKLPERSGVKRDSSTSDQVFVSANPEQRPERKANDKMYYSGAIHRSGESRNTLVPAAPRRTYSDDYENSYRRECDKGSSSAAAYENNAYANSASRLTYAPNALLVRQSRSVGNPGVGNTSYYSPRVGKRGSIEYKSNTKEVEVYHRRAMSQYDPRPRKVPNSHETRPRVTNLVETSRPRTPVPSPEIEEIYRDVDYRMFAKTSGFATRPRRNSTNYKVYLT
ncbi:uncharacterized protein LOC131663458 isoform X1 [Phymastichus coffea]|uniref:uncharacterized protein LOC131663458 isoform X1 n=1 Tax=Phymastichus coffea TaxID=108790 RepID=UPI00273BB54D|nr:uncharacterized protein LOC131663458 isoform X1 [Phymastichus coffea]